jgi:hypothetical protein
VLEDPDRVDGANPVAGVQFRRDELVLGFWLKRGIRSPRVPHKYLGRRDHIYEVRIRSVRDLDDELRAWLCESYLVGSQEWPSPKAPEGQAPEHRRERRGAALSRAVPRKG